MAQTGFNEMFTEFRAFCEAHADADNVRKWARYFKEGFDAYGVDNKLLIEFRRSLLDKYKSKLTVDKCLDYGQRFLATGKYEDAFMAIALGRYCLEHLGTEHLPQLAQWLDEGVTNWASSDVLCSEVLSPLLLSGQVALGDLAGWRDAPGRWRRRALAVAVIPHMKRTRQIPPVLALLEPLVHDSARVVHQGVGWSLRECWKLDPVPVEELLLRHRATAPRLVYQYACEKMTAQARDRFRKPK